MLIYNGSESNAYVNSVSNKVGGGAERLFLQFCDTYKGTSNETGSKTLSLYPYILFSSSRCLRNLLPRIFVIYPLGARV